MENGNINGVVVCLIAVVIASNVLFKAWRKGNRNTGLIFGLWVCLIILSIKIIGI